MSFYVHENFALILKSVPIVKMKVVHGQMGKHPLQDSKCT